MTISKEKFEQLVLDVWHQQNIDVHFSDIKPFANALIKRVEVESEKCFIGSNDNVVLELPLVKD